MLTMGAGSTAGATDFSTTSVKFPKRTKGLYTAEMKTKVMALADDEIDGGEMLVLDAMLKGSETKNGSEGTSIAGVNDADHRRRDSEARLREDAEGGRGRGLRREEGRRGGRHEVHPRRDD